MTPELRNEIKSLVKKYNVLACPYRGVPKITIRRGEIVNV
jgi:hypothetical protein